MRKIRIALTKGRLLEESIALFERAGIECALPVSYTHLDVYKRQLLSVARVTEGALRQYGALPILCAGGVMCNTLIRARMEKQFSAHFADAAFSADNAAGCAVLAYLKNERARGRTGDGD